MCRVKEMWHKEEGVQGFHLVQSFAAGEVSPELAHQIGLEFSERLLGGNFQAVVSTHLNTKCIHNHIVWNSVSMKNGRKYRSNERTYVTEVRQISDELCRKHDLSIIHTEKSERVARPYPTLQDYIKMVVIPDMQVKLRQGFGRAIRTETDTCVVSILDYRAAVSQGCAGNPA